MIHSIAIEIPWPVAPLNVFLVETEPLTLVDTGANYDYSLARLEASLGGRGYRLEEIGRVVVTHQHVEHLGLASVIRERAAAEICAIEGLVDYMADVPTGIKVEDEYEDALMARHGVPPELIVASRLVEDAKLGWDCSVEVDRVLEPGARLEFSDRVWEVLLLPGHSPYDTVFFDRGRGELFSGDHLLANISSNPLITYSGDFNIDDPPRALADYRESLRRTAELGAERVYAGHGPVIENARELIEHRMERTDARQRAMRDALGDSPKTAHEIAAAIWGPIAIDQPYLTLSEVLGHMADLEDAGVAERVERGETLAFRRV